MSKAWSVYEAKSRFSELIRKVRAGQRVRISLRGEEVAEIRPIVGEPQGFEERIGEFEERGRVSLPPEPCGHLLPLARRKGALARFLAERE